MDISDSQALGFMRRAVQELNYACAQSRLTLIETHELLRATHNISGAAYDISDANKRES
jgi:hypothetical protein